MLWLDKLLGYDTENAARAAAAGQKRLELDNQAYLSGRLSEAEWQRRGTVGYSLNWEEDPERVQDTLNQGIIDNANAMSAGLNSGLSFTLRKLLGVVPWWLWIVGAAALFVYMGGGTLLKGKLSKLK